MVSARLSPRSSWSLQGTQHSRSSLSSQRPTCSCDGHQGTEGRMKRLRRSSSSSCTASTPSGSRAADIRRPRTWCICPFHPSHSLCQERMEWASLRQRHTTIRQDTASSRPLMCHSPLPGSSLVCRALVLLPLGRTSCRPDMHRMWTRHWQTERCLRGTACSCSRRSRPGRSLGCRVQDEWHVRRSDGHDRIRGTLTVPVPAGIFQWGMQRTWRCRRC